MCIPVVSIIAAKSGTGKTTFMEKLIHELVERGLRVGAVKNAYEFDIDKQGKDTWKYGQAGAETIAVLGHDRYAVIKKTKKPETLDYIIGLIKDVDIILIEGFKKEKRSSIEIVRKEKGREIISSIDDLLALVTDVFDLDVPVPKYGLDDAEGVADLIQSKINIGTIN